MTTKRKRGVCTIRQIGTGRTLFDDPDVGWRWAGGGKRTELTRELASELVSKFGGVVCVDGVPDGMARARPPKMPPGGAPGERDKPAELRALIDADRWKDALRLARRMRIQADRKALDRAWEAFTRPEFLRQLGRDPEQMIEAGIAELRRWRNE